MFENLLSNESALEQLQALLPEAQQEEFLTLLLDETTAETQVRDVLPEILAQIDWAAQREQLQVLLSQLLPVDQLVPEIYQVWRPVVRDALAFVITHLSPERLGPKLIEQVMLPPDYPLEQRLLILVTRIPVLQKMGQIIARNPHLDETFRAELTTLENAIQDMTQAEVRAEIEQQLSPQLNQYQVNLQNVILAEASVSAVIGFFWSDPETNNCEQGVFKVLKPYVKQYFQEELSILQHLSDFFDEHRADYDLPPVNFRGMMDEVRLLLEHEVDLPKEQATLTLAAQQYAAFPQVRVPRLISELCTPSITAISAEKGVKVIDAFPDQPDQRRQLAQALIEILIAVPLFAPQEVSFFHADPHAGNLFVDEAQQELVLLDWALVTRLSYQQRRHIVLLTAALVWRDAHWIYQALTTLVQDDLETDQLKQALVRGYITQLLAELAPFILPGFTQAITLVDRLALAGISFSAELLLFRKILFTLEGVLHDISPDVQTNNIMLHYILSLMVKETPYRLLRLPISTTTFHTHLSNLDLTKFIFNLPLLGQRLVLKTIEDKSHHGFDRLQRIFS